MSPQRTVKNSEVPRVQAETRPIPSRWRVTRVDEDAVTVVPNNLAGAAALEAAGRTWRTDPEGTLPAMVGEPFAPAVGDWVHVAGDVVRLAPRISELVRDTAGVSSSKQVVAANVDTVLIVEPLEPAPVLGRIEQLLDLARRAGARPVVVLTKADRAADTFTRVRQVEQATSRATVVATSTKTGAGLEELQETLAHASTLVLMGPSGAGKSTLVNVMAGVEVVATQDVAGGERNTDTTSDRVLVPLGGGRVLIDTSGV